MLQACLNGRRPRGDHPAVPLTPEELAADARRAIAAGAAELHVHPRAPGGADTTEPGAAGATVRAIRAACPGVPLGLTTGLWTTDGDAELRHAQVEAWEDLPDYVSVNIAEPGSAELCELLGGRGVGIEAGVWNLADAHLLLERGLVPLRVLVETSDGGAEDPVAAAADIPAEDAGLGDVELLSPALAVLAMLAWIGAAFAAGYALLRGRDVH